MEKAKVTLIYKMQFLACHMCYLCHEYKIVFISNFSICGGNEKVKFYKKNDLFLRIEYDIATDYVQNGSGFDPEWSWNYFRR